MNGLIPRYTELATMIENMHSRCRIDDADDVDGFGELDLVESKNKKKSNTKVNLSHRQAGN